MVFMYVESHFLAVFYFFFCGQISVLAVSGYIIWFDNLTATLCSLFQVSAPQ